MANKKTDEKVVTTESTEGGCCGGDCHCNCGDE
jgi:hypothetical protein